MKEFIFENSLNSFECYHFYISACSVSVYAVSSRETAQTLLNILKGRGYSR